MNLALAVSATLAACSFAPEPSASRSSDKMTMVSDGPDPRGQRGRMVSQLYQENCVSCHGDRGQGGGAGTKTLLSEELHDQKHDRRFFDAIKNGVPDMGMPSYGETLSDPEVWGLVVHIRELQATALRRAKGSTPRTGVVKTRRHNYRVETVIDADQGLQTPWAIAWLPDGRMLITNRPGKLVLARGNSVTGEVQGIPESLELGQGGLMEVAVHPDYARNGWVYLAYTEPARSGRGGLTKVVRGKLAFSGGGASWTSQQTIWEADQKFYTGAGVHFGTRIVFDGRGLLYFVVGERAGNMLAQELTNPFGKVYRLREDGSELADNPFVGKTDIKGVWTYGHRNPQGLVFDLNGDLWVTEHGPRGGDELNRIVRGSNYGWPVVAFSINYNGAPFRTPWPTQGQNIRMPIFRWLPSIGACGLDVMKGSKFPQWQGDLFAGGLSGANVDRVRVKGDQLIEREEILHGLGRVREVRTGPDGLLYIALNQPDKIIRLVPAD